MGILEYCLNKKIQIWTVKENYRLGNDIQSKVMAFAFGLAAEIERNLISQRTKASLENLKAQGIKLGRPNKSKIEDAKFKSNVEGLCDTGMSIPDIALKLKIARSTLYRFFQLSRNKEDENKYYYPPKGGWMLQLRIVHKYSGYLTKVLFTGIHPTMSFIQQSRTNL